MERERAPRRNPGRAQPADFSAADTWDDSLEWPRSPAEPPPSYDRRESERDASPSGSGRQPPNDEEEFGARGERRESRYGAREDFGYDDWVASEPRGAYDDWRRSGRDGRSGPGWNPAESLPGVMGAATRAILAACSGMSDVTARALAGMFPRSVPMASLRTLAYLLWGFLFFVVFQRVISGFVLVGGLLLLAIAVAQGETSGGHSWRDPRDGRAWGAAFGSRGSNFDEFRDVRRRERRRRRARDFFGAAPMMEWWNERAEYERDFYGYPGGDDGDYNDTAGAGDDGHGYGFPSDSSRAEEEASARRRSYDSDGDFVDVTPPAIDWSRLADAARRAGLASEFRVVNEGINEGIKMAGDAVRGFQGTFEGAGGAGEAGFSFGNAATAKETGDFEGSRSAKEPADRVDGLDRSMGAAPDDDDDAGGQSSGDPTVVDVEARAVPFDEWFSRGSTDESDRGFSLTSDDDAAGTPSSSSSSPPPPPPREGRAAYRDPPPRWTAGTYRDPNASAREKPRGEGRDDWAERRAEWGYGAFGRDAGAPPGSDRGGAGRNRWREFMTGRFYGEFQEDLIAARFDVGGGVAVDEEDEEERGAKRGRGANLDDDDDPGAGAVR